MRIVFTSFAIMLVLLSCAISRNPETEAPLPEETATYYVVIADTSVSYGDIHAKILDFYNKSQLEIDSMGRYFDVEKGKLIVPEDDPDELYRGEYYPRRFPSTHLSIEYLYMYQPDYTGETFACIAGIFEKKKDAEALTRRWRSQCPHMYVQKAEIYVGCMH